MVLTY